MRRTLMTLMLIGLLMMLTVPALAVIHVTVPADDCSPNDNAVGNDQFEAVIRGLAAEGILSLPLGNVTMAPTTCPAP